MGLSIGIGLTNDCNLNCAHCYRPTDQVYRLTLADIKTICQHLPVSAMGMGTGENGLHPQFLEIVGYLRDQGIKLTMASNGYSLNTIPDEYLRAFHDVEVSIDFPTEQEQDLFRGRGNWQDVHAARERCRKLGIEVSVLATMMNTNYDKMDGLARLARSLGANLRVNVYQPVRTDRFQLSYEQFWEGYRRLFASAQLVSCTEPVVRAVLGLGSAVSPCGRHSIRFTPQGQRSSPVSTGPTGRSPSRMCLVWAKGSWTRQSSSSPARCPHRSRTVPVREAAPVDGPCRAVWTSTMSTAPGCGEMRSTWRSS